MRLIFASVGCLLLCVCSFASGAENLVSNGGFGDRMCGWQTALVSGKEIATAKVVKNEAGQEELVLTVQNATASVYHQVPSLAESGFYELTATVHFTSGEGRFRIGLGWADQNGPTICQSNHVVRPSMRPAVLRAMCYTAASDFRHEVVAKVFLELEGPAEVRVRDVRLTFLSEPLKTTKVSDRITAHHYGGGWEILDVQGRKDGPKFPVTRAVQVQNQEPAPSPQDGQRGFITFVPAAREGVLPDAHPTDSERSDNTSIFASAGEFELATFVIRPLRDLGNFTFHVGDFVSESGERFSSAATDLYVGDETIEQVGLFGKTFVRRVKWLRPADTAEAKTGRNVQVFVDVKVPVAAPPGTYTAPIEILSEQAPSGRFDLTVEVLALTLNRARNWGAYVYGWHGMPHRRENAMLKLRELKRHGMTQCVISPLAIQNRPGYEKDKTGSPDFTYYGECVKLYQEAGLSDPVVLGMEGWLFSITESLDQSLLPKYKFGGRRLIGVMPEELPDDFKALPRRGLRRLYDHGLEQSWPPFYAYLADEPWSRGKTRLGALLMYPLAREAAGSLRTATSLYEDMGPFAGLVDMNFHHFVHPCATAESAAASRRTSDDLNMKVLGMGWSTAVEDTFFDHSRVVGFMIEKCGLGGMMPWVQWVIGPVKDLSKPADPYRDIHNYFKGGPWSRYDREGRISRSLNVLGYREAIDDSRYAQTARALAKRARASFEPNVRARGRAAEAKIDALLEQVPYKEAFNQKTTPWDDALATKLRRRIAQVAIELEAAVGVDEFWQEENKGPEAGQSARVHYEAP